MRKHGVDKGDRVLIYMPMIPQAIIAMLATARLGAIHSLVFGGFAAKELAVRIDHAEVSKTKSVNMKEPSVSYAQYSSSQQVWSYIFIFHLDYDIFKI